MYSVLNENKQQNRKLARNSKTNDNDNDDDNGNISEKNQFISLYANTLNDDFEE